MRENIRQAGVSIRKKSEILKKRGLRLVVRGFYKDPKTVKVKELIETPV